MSVILQSVVRHLLSSFGGALIAIGIADDQAHNFLTASEPIITGLLLFIGAQGWSFFEKRE